MSTANPAIYKFSGLKYNPLFYQSTSTYVNTNTQQTIYALKNFTAGVNTNTLSVSSSVSLPNNSIIQSEISGGYVDLTNTQTVAGAKTFSNLLTASNGLTMSSGTLTLPSSSITQTMVSNGYVDLSSTQTVGGVKTFSSNIVHNNVVILQWKNNGGTAYNVLYVDSANATCLLGAGGPMYINANPSQGTTTHITYNNSNNTYIYYGTTATATFGNAKVGINNSSPSYDLDVAGQGRFSSYLITQAGLAVNTLSITSGYVADINGALRANGNMLTTAALVSNQQYTASGIYPANGIVFETNNAVHNWYCGQIIGYVAAGAGGSTLQYPGGLAFYTKPADTTSDYGTMILRMVLDSQGYLGIGTSTPSYLLDVNGTGRFSSNLTVGGTTTSTGLLTASNGLTMSSGTLTLPSSSITQTMVSNGYVDLSSTQTVGGVKTFSSNIVHNNGVALQWKNNGGTTYNVLYVDSANNTCLLGAGGPMYINNNPSQGTTTNITYNNSNNTYIYYGTTATATFGNNTATIGSGLTTQLANLSISQTLTASGIYPSSTLNFMTNNSVHYWYCGQIIGYVAAGASGSTAGYPGGLAFYTKPADGTSDYGTTSLRMVLDAQGYLGIGTSTPSYQLDVNGTGRFSSDLYTQTIHVQNSMEILSTAGNFYQHFTQDSTGVGSGAIQCDGGMYVAKQLRTGGDLTVGGNLTVVGTYTFNALTVKDLTFNDYTEVSTQNLSSSNYNSYFHTYAFAYNTNGNNQNFIISGSSVVGTNGGSFKFNGNVGGTHYYVYGAYDMLHNYINVSLSNTGHVSVSINNATPSITISPFGSYLLNAGSMYCTIEVIGF